jgi:hypothetical protein
VYRWLFPEPECGAVVAAALSEPAALRWPGGGSGAHHVRARAWLSQTRSTSSTKSVSTAAGVSLAVSRAGVRRRRCCGLVGAGSVALAGWRFRCPPRTCACLAFANSKHELDQIRLHSRGCIAGCFPSRSAAPSLLRPCRSRQRRAGRVEVQVPTTYFFFSLRLHSTRFSLRLRCLASARTRTNNKSRFFYLCIPLPCTNEHPPSQRRRKCRPCSMLWVVLERLLSFPFFARTQCIQSKSKNPPR